MKTDVGKLKITSFLLMALVLLTAHPVAAAPYDVTETECSADPGGLLWAIEQANATPGLDVIDIQAGLQITRCPFPRNSEGEVVQDESSLVITDSLTINGNGATYQGINLFINLNGNVNLVRRECPPGKDEVLLGAEASLFRIGELDTGNSGLDVVINDMTVKRVSQLAQVRDGANLTLRDVTGEEITDVVSCSRPAIVAFGTADLVLENLFLKGISSYLESDLDATIRGETGKLEMYDSRMENAVTGHAVRWDGDADIVSAYIRRSGALEKVGPGEMRVVNSLIWPSANSTGMRFTDISTVTGGGQMHFEASTLLYEVLSCDTNVPSKCYLRDYPLDGVLQAYPGSTMSFTESVVHTQALNSDLFPDPYPLLGKDGSATMTADEYTFMQPVPWQTADQLKTITGQPNLRTAPPALPVLDFDDPPIFFFIPFPDNVTPIVDGVLDDEIADAGSGGGNELLDPRGNPITHDVLGNPRTDEGFRSIGAVQNSLIPHLIVAGVGDGTVDLNWTKPRDLDELCGYRLTYREKGTTNNDLTVDFLDPDELSFQVTGLTNGIEYEFEVEGLVDCPDPDLSGFPSNLVTATPQGSFDCAILADRKVEIGGGAVIAADVCSNGNLRTGAKTTVGGSVLGLGNLNLGIGTGINLDAIGNGNLTTDGKVNIGLGDGPDDLDVDVGGRLKLGWKTRVEGECRYVGSISTGFGAECGSETLGVDPPLASPFALPACAVTPPPRGAPNLHQRWYSTTDLTPDDYGHASFGFRSTVRLAAGEYHFQSLSFGAGTRIEILGPVDLHVVDTLNFGVGAHQVLTNVQPNEIVYRVGGKWGRGVHSGGNTVLYGTFCTPSSTIALGIGSELWGGAIGKDVKFGSNVFFLADPAPVQ